MNVGHRTTNMAEGWHNALNEFIGRSHLSLRSFLDELQLIHNAKLARMAQLLSGHPQKKKRSKYVDLNDRLTAYFHQFETDFFHTPGINQREVILAYLDRCQYLLSESSGGNNEHANVVQVNVN